MPNAKPHASAATACGASSLTAMNSAVVASISHVSEVTWFMCEPLMNTTNGAKAKSSQRQAAHEAARLDQAEEPRKRPRTHDPGHRAHQPLRPEQAPSASIAGPPAGNWP